MVFDTDATIASTNAASVPVPLNCHVWFGPSGAITMTSRRAASVGMRVSAANDFASLPKPWKSSTSGVGAFDRYAVGIDSKYGCATPAVVMLRAVVPTAGRAGLSEQPGEGS